MAEKICQGTAAVIVILTLYRNPERYIRIMPKPIAFLLPLILCFVVVTSSAQVIKGVVTDTSGKPLAFATIKIGDTKQGLMADLNGKFRLRVTKSFSYIIISHLGYQQEQVNVEHADTSVQLQIKLLPADKNLDDVVVSSSTNKLKRILGGAINNRSKNNPEKYNWYQCKIYYKTTVDILSPDSISTRDTSAEAEEWRERMKQQHMFITETYSKRTWERPQKLQEDVIASRVSGFKKAWFTSLVTDVLPFHAYNDFLTFNGKDYHNPLSSGYWQRFDFRIQDELLTGTDTVWVISYQPKKDKENLSGTLYISSNQFAISHLIAQHYDSSLRRLVGIEQQYVFEHGKWFPDQLNYFISWKGIFGEQELYMKGISSIDSVTFEKKQGFKFDKAHTARLQPKADERTNAEWKEIRPASLSAKEERTYEFIDSIGNKHHFDNITLYMDRLSDGYFPAGKFDIDLQRIYSYNNYEKHRLGFGLRTSKKLSQKFSVGGWFGYGTGDKNLKYGGFAEVYADRYREFKFRAAYQNDLQDPGRLQINEELDKNFLRRFLLGRVDKIRSYSFEVYKKFGYLSTVLGINHEQIIPQYDYSLDVSGKAFKEFETKEITLGFRYAYAERMSPIFGKYLSNGSKYPIVYGKVRFGEVNTDKNQYVHAVAAVKWQKHINHLGNEQFLLMAGGVFSKKPLPISKLFAGNGFRTEDQSFYVFGGMQTMLPYDYYSDRFINFYWKHDFDFKFYNAKLTKGLSSSPTLSFGYNVLYGSLKNPEAHKNVHFSIPDKGYHEVGMMLNRVVRIKVMGMMYMNLNAGYFYHLDGPFNKQNGRFVFGISADL